MAVVAEAGVADDRTVLAERHVELTVVEAREVLDVDPGAHCATVQHLLPHVDEMVAVGVRCELLEGRGERLLRAVHCLRAGDAEDRQRRDRDCTKKWWHRPLAGANFAPARGRCLEFGRSEAEG